MLNSLQYHFAVMGLIYISDIGNGLTTDLQRNYNGRPFPVPLRRGKLLGGGSLPMQGDLEGLS